MWKGHWGNPNAPLSFQLLVPIGVAVLVAARRQRLAESWRGLKRQEIQERKVLTGGSLVPLAIGCVLLLGSHLVHLSLLAVIGLQLIAIGVVVRVYGRRMLKELIGPLVFWLLMWPPPETAVGHVVEIARRATARLAAVVLHLLGKPALGSNGTLLVGDAPLDLTTAASGLATLLVVSIVLLCYGLVQRRTASRVALLVVFGGTLAVLTNLLRVVTAGMLAPGSPEMAQTVNALNPWFLAVPLIPLTLVLDRLGQRWGDRVEGVLAAVLRPLGRAVRAFTRPLDRGLTQSGKVAGAAGRGIAGIFRPLVWLTDQTVRGFESLFKVLGRSAQGIERSMKRLERRKGGKRGRR
jgi:exosortase/archaeosortase family protein